MAYPGAAARTAALFAATVAAANVAATAAAAAATGPTPAGVTGLQARLADGVYATLHSRSSGRGALAAARSTGTGGATSLLAEPGPATTALYVSPVAFNGSLEGPVAANHSVPAAWFVTQWSNPEALGLDATAGDNPGVCATPSGAGTAWWDATSSVAVCMAAAPASGGGVSMAESGVGDDLACGQELDTFLCPNNPIYTNVAPNLLIDRVDGTLANMTALTLAWNMTLAYGKTAARCGSYPQCGSSGHVDYGYGVAAVTLSNAPARQTLFYQIILWDTRTVDCPAASPCVPFTSWFFTSLPTLGVSDSIAALPGAPPCLPTGAATATSFNLELYSRLTHYVGVAASQYGADGDLAHWVVGDLYIGTGLEGSATVTSAVAGVALTASFTG